MAYTIEFSAEFDKSMKNIKGLLNYKSNFLRIIKFYPLFLP